MLTLMVVGPGVGVAAGTGVLLAVPVGAGVLLGPEGVLIRPVGVLTGPVRVLTGPAGVADLTGV